MWQQLLDQIQAGDIKALARSISLVENEHHGYEELLLQLPPNHHTKIIGVTGPPGAGKSTLVDGLIGELVKHENNVAVLCVDPSSPFNMGAVLGDRIRMNQWYTHPNVFIRSLASRGSMGGLHPKIIEITELVKAANFDYIVLETVGVGQSEIEIAGLADTTVVVLVPEAGDEIQTMKAGLMEIADVFVVNKSDRPDSDAFVRNLRMMLAPTFSSHKNEVAIIKTVASEHKGLDELYEAIKKHQREERENERRSQLLAERVYFLIQKKRMEDIDKHDIKTAIDSKMKATDFNLYQFVEQFK
ncbi:MAG TPA: methylmalonyl Co-A mutase-associated GTPase MeaB [Flavisolibacter sp.]|nr:methylmalonyl Co-A mutase-associated GTPase MeaB [Flavisolibacter sp.]